MTEENRALFDSLLRQDLAAFTHRCFQTVVPGQTYLPNWHIEAIAYQLERCRRREIRKLIVTLPPRGLKSIGASVAFPDDDRLASLHKSAPSSNKFCCPGTSSAERLITSCASSIKSPTSLNSR